MNPKVSKIIELIAPLFLEKGLTKVDETIDEKKITDDFQEYLISQEEYNYLCAYAEEIDFEGLVEYIKEQLIDDVRSYVMTADDVDLDWAKKSILEKAYIFSKATSKEGKDKVSFIISNCLNILKRFYQSNLTLSDIYKSDLMASMTTNKVVEKSS